MWRVFGGREGSKRHTIVFSEAYGDTQLQDSSLFWVGVGGLHPAKEKEAHLADGNPLCWCSRELSRKMAMKTSLDVATVCPDR